MAGRDGVPLSSNEVHTATRLLVALVLFGRTGRWHRQQANDTAVGKIRPSAVVWLVSTGDTKRIDSGSTAATEDAYDVVIDAGGRGTEEVNTADGIADPKVMTGGAVAVGAHVRGNEVVGTTVAKPVAGTDGALINGGGGGGGHGVMVPVPVPYRTVQCTAHDDDDSSLASRAAAGNEMVITVYTYIYMSYIVYKCAVILVVTR